MNHKQASYIVLGAVGLAAALWLRKSLSDAHAVAQASGVTGSAKEGGIATTPLQPSKIAFAGIADPLHYLINTGKKATARVSSLASTSLTDWRQRQGNAASADAADSSPVQTNISNYRPSAWAPINFRSGV